MFVIINRNNFRFYGMSARLLISYEMSARLRLFYTNSLRNCVHCTFIYFCTQAYGCKRQRTRGMDFISFIFK